MPHPHDNTTPTNFGVGSGGFAQPDLWEALYGMTNINPALQLALQQYITQGGIKQQQISSGASQANSANQSAAQVYAAQIAAQGNLAQQNVQSGTAASIANSQNFAQLIAAMGGDQNAAHGLQASLGLEAGIQNQNIQQQILQMAATTGLRSSGISNAWMRGFGPQAQFGSAGNYWLDQL